MMGAAIFAVFIMMAVPPAGAAAGLGERELRLPLPAWADSREVMLAGLGGPPAAQPAGRDFEKYIFRLSPGTGAGETDKPALHPFFLGDWINHPLSSTRRPQRGEDLFQYQLGIYRFNNKEYRRAAEAFLELLNRFERSNLRAKALFWLAASYYGSGDWEDSEKSFRILLRGEASPWMRSTALVSLGWISRRRGRLGDALSYYRRFLDDNPDSKTAPLVTFLLGDVFYRLQKNEEAAEQFKRAFQSAPGGREKDRALYWWAESRRAAGSFEPARELYRDYLNRYPDGEFRDFAQYGVAWCALGEGRHDEAGRLFALIPEDHPQSSLADESLYLASWSLYRSGDWEGVLGVCDEIIEHYPASPWVGRTKHIRGMALYHIGRYEESLSAFSEVEMPGEDESLPAAATFMKAAILSELGRYAEASRLFEMITDGSGMEVPEGLIERSGWASFMAGDLKGAAQKFSQALNGQPGRAAAAEIHYWLGVVENERGTAEKAVLSFGRSLEALADGDRADESLLAIAEIYLSQKKWREAGELFRRLTESAADGELRAEALLRLAECLTAEERDEEALGLLLAYLGSETEDRLTARALFHIGKIHSQRRQYDKAGEQLQRLIAEHPDSEHADDAKLQIALGLYLDGRFADAVEEFEELITTYPDSSTHGLAHLRLGDSFYRLRTFDRALDHYQRVAADHPSGPYAPEAFYGINLIHLARGEFEAYRKGSIDFAKKNKNSPLVPTVLFQLGRQLLLHGDYDGAAKVFSVVVRNYPGEESWLHAMFHSAKTDRGAVGSTEIPARTAAALAAAEGDDIPLMRYRVAVLHLGEERCGEAVRELMAVGSAGKGHPIVRFALFEAAGCLVKEGKEAEAIETYRSITESYLDTEMGVWALYILGSLLFDKGEYVEAAAVLQRIPAGGGGELEAMGAFKLARALQKENKLEEAMATFIHARSLSPQGPFAQRASYRAAEIARLSGRAGLAASLFREALSLGGDKVITELSQEGLESVLSRTDIQPPGEEEE